MITKKEYKFIDEYMVSRRTPKGFGYEIMYEHFLLAYKRFKRGEQK